MQTPHISIIIPCYQERKRIQNTVAPLRGRKEWEILVVAAGRSNGKIPGCRTLQSPLANRALQMNLGAKKARGKLLLFLHADTQIRPESLDRLHARLRKNKKYLGGCFRFALDHPSWQARLMEAGVLLREIVFSLPYGDQGFFVWKKTFYELGGFAEVPIMEDVLFVKDLRSRGRLLYFEEPALTSARRWEQRGFFKNMVFNWYLMLLWKMGVPLEDLAEQRRRFFSADY